MRLSWNEIRIRAHGFAEKWCDAHYEKGETQTFYNEFFEIFGVERRRVARYEELIRKLDNRHGFIDLFWPKVLLVEQKSAGRDLSLAAVQAGEYFDAIRDSDKPRWQLLCDFQNFELMDRDTRESWSFTLAELPRHVELFGFILGIEKRSFRDQDPVNIEASELMGAIHDALEESGYRGHGLERYLVRLVFILFADDTGIFEPRDILLDLMESRTRDDGSDTGLWLHRLFEVLDTPEEERQRNLDEDLTKFPYVNGDLFADRLPVADFNARMREAFIEACRFNWSEVSPAIFGSLFQSVMDADERRKKGAHYTTEKNIMKVIGPLFLDDLRAEFEKIKARRDSRRRGELEAFRRRLGTLTFLDPACGCGNFLIIAYRELRQLELEALRELNPEGQRDIGIVTISTLDVDQFYGIEFEEFPARIAEVAMWMMDHIMNNKLSLEFGQTFIRIPLSKSPHIRHADALEFDWNDLLPAHKCSYVFGNPPFIGAKYQSEKQRAQVRAIARLGGSGGTLDYVAAWFLKAGAYVREGRAEIAFVSTNSITQGEQVAQLWPLLFDRYRLEIAFAHRTFAWGSEARGVAHVHVVVVGLTRADMEPDVKRLFSYPDIKADPVESRHKALTAYLFDAGEVANRHRVVEETVVPVSPRPKISFGNMPNDGGHLILSVEERDALLRDHAELSDLVRPLIGAADMLNGKHRYCLWLSDIDPSRLRASAFVQERVRQVKAYRLRSTRKATQKLAATPTLFGEIRHTNSPFVLVPRHTSERRDYVPYGFYQADAIAHDSSLFMPNAGLPDFGVLTSVMHMAWLRNIGGRLKSDYRYSISLVYNTFPWPEMTPAQEERIAALAQDVLDARAEFAGSTLSDLYDPDLMPPKLRRAHQALDRAVDRLYRGKPFASERERVEHLFGLYEKLVAPVEAAAKAKPKRKRAAASKDKTVTDDPPKIAAAAET